MESALAALKSSANLSGGGCIAVDGTSGTILMLNDAGQSMGVASLYNDPAPEAAVRAVAAAAPAGSAASAVASPLAKLLVMQDAFGMARLAHQADWIAARLGAPFGISDEHNALKIGYDPVRRCWPWLDDRSRCQAVPQILGPACPTLPHGPFADGEPPWPGGGYAVSQRIRKRIEEAFGWMTTVGGLRKTHHRGTARVGWQFTLTAAAYNFVPIPKLLAP